MALNMTEFNGGAADGITSFDMMNPTVDATNDINIRESNNMSNGMPMTDKEKQEYVDSLTDYQYSQMRNYKNQGYDFETAKALLESSNTINTYGQSYSSTGGDSNAVANVAQSIIDVPLNLLKLPVNLLYKGAAGIAKRISDNDEEIDAALQNQLQNIENWGTLPGVNREDWSYQIPNLVADLGVTVASSFIPIPGVGTAKRAEFATKFPKFAKLIKSVGGAEEMYKKYPGIAKFLRGGATGVKDVAIMNALEGEGTTPLEAIEGWLAGGVVEKGMGGLKKLSAYLETNGLLKPTDAENIIKKLKNRGELNGKLRDITWIADVMTKNGLSGTKQQVYDKAIKGAKDRLAILSDMFKIADKADAEAGITHSLKEADEAVELLRKLIKTPDGSPMIPRGEQLEFFESLIKKRGVGNENGLFNNMGKYSLSELQRLKNELDDLVGIYTDAGSVIEKRQAENWNETRKAIKKYLEKEMKKRGFGDIEMMNNEISTLYEIANGVAEKNISDSANKVSSVANTIADWAGPAAGLYLGYGAIKDLSEGDVDGAIAKGAGAFLLNNTYFKTHLGSYLNRLTGVSRNEIQQWIDSEGRTKLSKEASEEVAKIINENEGLKNQIKETAKQYLTQFPKESAMVGLQKGTEAVVDMIQD